MKRETIIAGTIISTLAGVVVWLLWFYLAPSITLRWPHPGTPTAYFQWRQRPTIVKTGLTKTAVLSHGTTYTMNVVLPPGQWRRGELVITSQLDLNNLHVRWNGQELAGRSAGGHAVVWAVVPQTGNPSGLFELRWTDAARTVRIKKIQYTIHRTL